MTPTFATRLGRLLIIPALALAAPAFAQAPVTQCDIIVQSQAGGMIEVISTGKLTEPPQIVWRPTPSNGRIEMLVFFPGDAGAALGEPSGLLMRFPLAASDPPDGVTLAIQSRNGRQWRFKGQSRDREGESGYVAFDQTLVYGRALLGGCQHHAARRDTGKRDRLG